MIRLYTDVLYGGHVISKQLKYYLFIYLGSSALGVTHIAGVMIRSEH